jgi:hypothetical protein
VVIIGGGVVGINAAKMAAGLGAHVTILDISLDRLRYLDDVLPANVDTAYSNRHNILACIRRADLVVGAVLLPGAKAPHLVKRADLKLMKPGSVIVDVAVDQGGCVETIKPTDPRRPDLLRRWHPALRRSQHAGRSSPGPPPWLSPTRRSPTDSSSRSWAGRKPAPPTRPSNSASTWSRVKWYIREWRRRLGCH